MRIVSRMAHDPQCYAGRRAQPASGGTEVRAARLRRDMITFVMETQMRNGGTNVNVGYATFARPAKHLSTD